MHDTDSPHDPVGHAIHAAFSAADDLIVLANKAETKELVQAEWMAIDQLLRRYQLLASFAFIEREGKMRLVRNG